MVESGKRGKYKQVVIPTDMKRYDRQLHRLHFITEELIRFVNNKDVQYGSSWRKRGGAGAFMVIARKWDRIEQACETRHPAKYDIFDVFEADDRSETILDDCLDLVGYLLILVEHMIEIGHVTEIKELNMKFIRSTSISSLDDAVVEDELRSLSRISEEPSGMKNPHGFDEEEDVPIESVIIDAQAASISEPEGEE